MDGWGRKGEICGGVYGCDKRGSDQIKKPMIGRMLAPCQCNVPLVRPPAPSNSRRGRLTRSLLACAVCARAGQGGRVEWRVGTRATPNGLGQGEVERIDPRRPQKPTKHERKPAAFDRRVHRSIDNPRMGSQSNATLQRRAGEDKKKNTQQRWIPRSTDECSTRRERSDDDATGPQASCHLDLAPENRMPFCLRLMPRA